MANTLKIAAPGPDPLLLSTSELARELRLSPKTIRRLNESGKLPRPIHIGHSLRWRREDVAKWLELGSPDRKAFELLTVRRGAK